MKNITAGLVACWKWLSGKKRTIALIYWTILVPSVTVIWPEQIPQNITTLLGVVGLVLSALGLGHATVKQVVKSLSSKPVPPPTPSN
jgi:hypothetical protein